MDSTILNVSTGLARFALPGYDAYATMKGGVETLTKSQAKTLGARGIRVNVIAPGAFETDLGGGVVRDTPEINKFIASQTALDRVGRADDIGSGWLSCAVMKQNGLMHSALKFQAECLFDKT